MAHSAFTVNNLAAAAPAAAPVAADFDGYLGNLDLSAPMSFIEENWKIVLSGNNQMDLVSTIRWVLWCVQGKANRDVNQGDIDMAMPIISLRFTTYTFLSLAVSTGTALAYRGSDTISAAQFNAQVANMHQTVAATAYAIYNFVATNSTALAQVGANAYLAPIAFVANKKHRDDEKGHNWFTGDVDVQGSTASKLIGMGGKRKDAFQRFMTFCGHDLWHFVPNGVMNILSDALAAGVALPINGVNPVIYQGEDVRDRDFGDVIDVGEACKDRYSGSIIGASSLILGVGYMKFFITQVSAKFPGIHFDNLDTASNTLVLHLKDEDLTRDALLEARDALSYTVAFTVGFCSAFSEMEDDIRRHPAITKFADSNVAGKATGASIGKSIKEVAIDQEALATMITAVVNNMYDGLKNAANATKTDVDEADLE